MLFISYIKKDINKILLFLTIIPILLFMIFSIHYQNALRNISTEYNEKARKLEESTGKVVLEQLNESIKLKEIILKDKETLEKGYYGLKSENENLKIGIEDLRSELNSAKSELEEQKSKFNSLQVQFHQVQNSLIVANEQISRLIAKNKQICEKLKTANSDEKC